MSQDILAPALIRSMARGFSMLDLIRTAETLKASGQEAAVEPLYATWIDHNPQDPLLYAALFNFAVVLADAGKLEPAKACLERAIAINPDFLPPYINLGRVYERMGAVGLAVVQWSAALGRLPQVTGTAITYKTTALNQIARTLEAANEDASAEDMLRQSLELDPRQREVAQHYLSLRQRQCEWPVIAPWDRVDRDTLMHGLSPLSAAAYTDDPMLHLAMAAAYNRADVGTPAAPLTTWPQAMAHDGRLRVGYLCSDFREHALGHLLAEVPGLHDRAKVEVFAYYCGPDSNDPLHRGFRDSSEHWIPVSGLDDAAAAQRMAADGIQILVDLNGYTREGRTKLVAHRPAPVIANWLGYPGTMGSPYHHYIIADPWIIPDDHEIYYSEKVLRLPCYQPTNRQRLVAERVPTRAEAGLPDDATVFCCFNGAHKITRFTFERWMMILSLVPGSVLWLLTSTDGADQRLKDQAAQRGIAPERLVFAPKQAHADHMARYPLADLFLDTTPYGAHTTASDALWMGVPVLTFGGRSFASRVCGSLVRSAGLPELVCDSAEAFVTTAATLGRDRARLAELRARLLAGRDTCVLFDTPALVRGLEDLYAGMWQDCQQGQLPQPDLCGLDTYLEVGCAIDHDTLEVQTIGDYRGWWRDQLNDRHRFRPVAFDQRLFPKP